MNDIVIWGAGGHAKVVAASIRRSNRFRVVGFVDDVNPSRAGEPFAGATVIGDRSAFFALRARGPVALHLAFGHCGARHRLGAELAAQGVEFPPLVDPTALIAERVVLGDGCFVGPGAVLNVDVRVGRHAIVNTAAIAEHDCLLGDAVHLAPRACLAGQVRVGERTWVGAGSVVRDDITIGSDCLVGLGSVVVRDLPDGVRAYGVPAVIREAP
jgi:sugar O-acyltransferase (sialic acid O-acetyltransferase NeuD family)